MGKRLTFEDFMGTLDGELDVNSFRSQVTNGCIKENVMTIEEARRIIDEESLKGGNLFEKREDKENEMIIANQTGQWLVYATDERASKITGSEKSFETEEEALDNFIKRLRALNVLKSR